MRTHALLSPRETGKTVGVHHLCYGRLTPGACCEDNSTPWLRFDRQCCPGAPGHTPALAAICGKAARTNLGGVLCLLAVLRREPTSLLAAVGGTALCYTFVYRNIPRDLATARLVFLILTGTPGYFLLSNLQVGLTHTHSPA